MARAVLALIALAAVLVWWSGVLGDLADPELLRARVAAAGAWGPLLFVGMAVALFAVFMLAPAIWAAPLLWPLPEALTYSLIAALAGSVGTYWLTRQLGRQWARRRIPPRVRRWEERLEARPLATVVVLRLLLWANPLVDMLIAVNPMPVRTYMLGTCVGLVPPTAFHVALGAGGGMAIGLLPWWAWALAAGLLAVGIAAYRIAKVRRVDAGHAAFDQRDRE